MDWIESNYKSAENNLLKISIITPNYNYAKFIGQTIDSVVSQDYPEIEHIIVDDGSTDNSVEIIKEYIKRFPNKIKLIQQENKGQTSAINLGLKDAQGDIIGWINSDDYYNKDVFSLIIDYFKKDSNIDAVFGDIGLIDENDRFIRTNKYSKFDYASGVFNGFGKVISSNAIFWKKKLTQETGFLDESFDVLMDSEYWSRLLLNRNVKKIKTVIANFRWHPKAKTIISHNKLSNYYIKAKIENNIITKNSYSKLKISGFIPYKYSKIIWFFYRIKRYIFRFRSGQLFK